MAPRKIKAPGPGKTLTRTQETLRDILSREANYNKVSRGTKISSSRLQEIYKGGRVTSSEASKIANYNKRNAGIDITPEELSDIVGFTEEEIKRKMRYPPSKNMTALQNKKRAKKNITRLTWDDLTRSNHAGYFVAGHRKSNELALYYVIIQEDYRTNTFRVGHGFMDYDLAKQRIELFGVRPSEPIFGIDGDIYMVETIIYDIFMFDDEDKQFILDHR